VGERESAVEVVGLNGAWWRGRRVLVTGLTGFKGGWLALWLAELGAEVVGYALPPPTTPSLFELARVREAARWIPGDVCDLGHLRQAVGEARAEVVFHLAAQPLVRASYESPVETFTVNVMGTVNVLEALRHDDAVRAVVIVTSDKCYENVDRGAPFREDAPLGGRDPYSGSKSCAEIATRSYYRSFFAPRRVGVATARAGNVIGGGDWARDRIVPDIVAALAAGRSVAVRSPAAVRPWQHVLDPLAGYLALAEGLVDRPGALSDAWNFGPDAGGVRSVAELATSACAYWGRAAGWHAVDAPQPHEAATLRLDASKARSELAWRPRLPFDRALEWTLAWYRAHADGEDMRARTLADLRRYIRDERAGS
jgi:CDP-glucose 4,6-dehydratase